MSDDDLIRRVDARRILEEEGFLERSLANLNDLTAMQVAVKPLEWFEVEKYRYGGKYTSEGYTIRYVGGFFILDFAGYGKAAWRFPTLEAAKAAALADHAARIRSALTVTTHDPAKVQSREMAYQAYINEMTPNGNSRMDNITICAGPNENHQRHIASQVDMAFQAGWFAALAAMKEGK